ncbi:TM2 domain-containing protein [Serratia marcescens]|jgi:Predicted membrane protein|uniref:TM2 domain-containing protein n=1 Tax=Serratia TaxID=613 RepID=UPI0028B4A085|nr:TM2 domain-containing protein [Serratia marcescens]ELI8844704.1 TM2 domain-containing protein [Serratia marcescens]HEB0103036.1 TM2 domain-containing protein [Serratia marcescens]HEJ9033992.1 TM2 domain-containing protein [Serratia marcescens]
MSRKDKLAAALLAIFLGGLGIHKFYLGMKWWGLFYLLFCWTGIPAVVGFIEGIIYLFQSEEKFNQKYNPGLI